MKRINLTVREMVLLSSLAFIFGTGCPSSNSKSSHTSNGKGQASAAKVDEPWEFQLEKLTSGQSQSIEFFGQPISASQLNAIAGNQNLTKLILDKGRVSDSEIGVICSLTHLQHLRLRESPISDIGLKQIAASLHELQILNLPQATVTADGIADLSRLSSLTNLRLKGRQIDDGAVSAIANIESLTSLHLIGPNLTDAALKTIAGMNRLQSFYLDECPLSDQAWSEFFSKRPRMHVHIGDQMHHDLDPNAH